MRNPVGNLKKIVGPQSLKEAQSGTHLVLEERDRSNPYKIELKGVPAGSLLVKTDNFNPPRRFLVNKNGLHKRADFALIDNDKIIFIELKSGSVNTKEIVRQFCGAKCVMDYCASIGKHYFNDPNFLNPAIIDQNCVLLVKKKNSIKKRRIVPPPKSKRTGNVVFKRLDCVKEVYYKQLVD